MDKPVLQPSRLRQERIERSWRQRDLAEQLGTTVVTIQRWERGTQQPGIYFRAKLCVLFGKSAEELGLAPEDRQQAGPVETKAATSEGKPILYNFSKHSRLWNIPFPRNPFFTGRDLVLEQLHGLLKHKSTMAALTQSYALHGLGGIGKTQLAVEYAYRHRSDYNAVLWIEAETQATLISSFVALAELLSLPEKAEDDHNRIVSAVLRWLNQQKGWLLIFDDIEDLSLLKPFLPTSERGSLLLTTRLHSLGTLAQALELSPMTIQEGCDFLLARTKRLHWDGRREPRDPQEETVARAIIAEMGGLPLAIEQAGAYIDSTQCSLSDYLYLFQIAQNRLLGEHEPFSTHPLSVSQTFVLAFEHIEQRHLLAAKLLTVCAFLAPDAIPETFLLEGASSLGLIFERRTMDLLAYQEAIKVLLSYSLLQRNATAGTITVHRLVQTVLKGWLSEDALHIWIKRVVETMARLFPSDEETQNNYWLACEQLLSHAQRCLTLAKQWEVDAMLHISLMSHIAAHLSKHARYTEAEPLFAQARQMGEQNLDQQHPLIGEVLHGLADLYRGQGKYSEAELFFERALGIREQVLGMEHPLVATTLERSGLLYYYRSRYELAESLLLRALHIREQASGPEQPQVAYSLNTLGNLYWKQGKYELAESVLLRTLRIYEQGLGLEHPQVAYPLHTLGIVYHEQGKYELAESLLLRALHIRERTLDPEHPELAKTLNSLGLLYWQQGKYEQTEPFYQRALYIQEHTLGSEHPDLAYPLTNLGYLYRLQGKYKQAEASLLQALNIWERTLGSEHPQTAYPILGLGVLYYEQGKYERAEANLLRTLHIWEQAFGAEYPPLAYPLDGLGLLHLDRGSDAESESFLLRALHVSEQALGPEHSEIAYPLNSLGLLRLEQDKYAEAEVYLLRALRIREHALSSEHPEFAYPLGSLGLLYCKQGQYEQAKTLLLRALHIWEQTFGSDHILVAEQLSGLANLYRDQGQYEQALPLYQRVLILRQRHLDPQHPKIAETLHEQACLYSMLRQFKDAISSYRQALAIRERVFGPHHSKTQKTHRAIIQLLQERGQAEEAATIENLLSKPACISFCACGCSREIDTSKSRGEPKRFFSAACRQRFYRNALQQKKRNTNSS